MTLSEKIREAVDHGGLTALTLWPCADGWQCNARFKRGHSDGWKCVVSACPVEGLLEALSGAQIVAPVAEEDGGGVFG